MLYPNINELISYKDHKPKGIFSSHRKVASIIPGDHHSPFRGQGLEFDSVREYVFGDDIRNIDWRVTARTGKPHLKLFREERERQVIIAVDMNEAMRFGTRKTFKSVQAARAAALLAWRACSQHNPVGACLFGDIKDGVQLLAPKKTKKSLLEMFKFLAAPPEAHRSVPLATVLPHIVKAAHTGSLIYIISDFLELSEEIVPALSRLNKRCDVVFVSINDPADKSLVPAGAIEFCSGASETVVVDTNSLAGREAYREKWIANRRTLHALTSRLKIAMLELTTESDVVYDLTLGLKRLSRRGKK